MDGLDGWRGWMDRLDGWIGWTDGEDGWMVWMIWMDGEDGWILGRFWGNLGPVLGEPAGVVYIARPLSNRVRTLVGRA